MVSAAAVATSENSIEENLNELINNPNLLIEYATASCKIGIENHSKENILNLFRDTINQTLEAGN